MGITKLLSMNSLAYRTDRRRFLMGLALLAAWPAVMAQGQGMTALPSAQPAPSLGLEDIDGKGVDIMDYRGKVVLVNFWATWCPPCRKEFPSLGRVRQLFKPEEFEVLAVNVGEEAESVFSFTGVTAFPALLDPEGRAMAAWPVKGLPTTFLVDRQGYLAYRATGGREFDDPDIVAAISALLKP